jgi:type IV pilus assembly protein PilB
VLVWRRASGSPALSRLFIPFAPGGRPMTTDHRKAFAQLLIEQGLCTKTQIKEALGVQKEKGGDLGDILVGQGYLSESDKAAVLGKQFGLEVIDLDSYTIDPMVVDLLPRSVARKHQVLPLTRENNVVKVAITNPLDFEALDNLRFILNSEIQPVLATTEAVRKSIDRFYETEVNTVENIIGEFTDLGDESDDESLRSFDLGATTGEDDDAPVIRLVRLIVSEAVKSRASDIHIEPLENRLRIRYRIDGDCVEVDSPPKRLQNSIISRVKIMSGMAIEEKRLPQDGRIRIRIRGKEIDIRVSTLPASHGESVVLRLLDKENVMVGIEKLGFHETDRVRFEKIIKRPNGIFLVTGPTGSGKTTTLYSALQELNRPDRKIITAEDPVEYNISGINQCEVKERIGMTFSRILRAMLRQAPNIILVGEIRDAETAEIAIQAALTGHLVFSTLHTNDAPSAITRLVDMGMAPFLVASSIQAIMAQRLVRVICPDCKEPWEIDLKLCTSLGLGPQQLEGRALYHGRGCRACVSTGYHGRLGIFELMEMTRQIREMAFRVEPTNVIRDQARRSGMVTLQEDGVRKVLAGITTVNEVLTNAQRDITINL